MKKLIAPFLFLLIPVIVFAGAFDGLSKFQYNRVNPASRAWRMSQQIQSYADGSQWIPEMRIHPYYNDTYHARVDSLHMDSWDGESGEWIPSVMVSYLEYNAAGRITSNQIYMNLFGNLIPMMKLDATFDNQSRITHMYMYSSDMENGGWISSFRLHLSYLTGGGVEVYGWEEDEQPVRLSHYFHSTFVTEANGRILEEHSFTSPDSTSWVNDYKQIYQYHAQDNTTGADFIEYMSQNLPWMMMNDNNFIFPGLITHWDSFYWNGSGWIPEDRADITYNAELLKIMHYEEYYNGEVWYPENRRNYFYDDNNNLSYEIEQENNFDILVDSRRTDYTWEQYTANDEDLIPASGLSLKAYPSPFNDNITIQADSKELSPVVIGIYNLRGQLIRQYLSQPGQAVIWNGSDQGGNACPAGIYFLKVNQGPTTSSAKLIKIK